LEPPPEDAAAVAALKQQLASAEAKYKAGQFNVSMRELVAQYVALEEYYMEETASMAIRLDQMVGVGGCCCCMCGVTCTSRWHYVRCPMCNAYMASSSWRLTRGRA
jgi:hypothetical protein